MEIGSLPPVTLPAFNPLSQSPESETRETPVLLGAHGEEETAQDRLDSTNAAHHLPVLASGIIAANKTAAATPSISLPGAPELDAALTASVLSAQRSHARQSASPTHSDGQNAVAPLPQPAVGVGKPVADAHPVAAAATPTPVGETNAGGTGAASPAAETGDRGTGGPGTEELTEEEQQKVQELKSRDREVRQHEQAHMAAAGGYARGGPSYEYTTGPDNRRYATGGEVSIDTSKVADDPAATIRKAQIIYRAAMAPAEPSSQDRSVASEAKQMESEARRELAESRRSEATEENGQSSGNSPVDESSQVAETGEDGDVIPKASSEQFSGSHSAGQTSSFDGAGAAEIAGDAGQFIEPGRLRKRSEPALFGLGKALRVHSQEFEQLLIERAVVQVLPQLIGE